MDGLQYGHTKMYDIVRSSKTEMYIVAAYAAVKRLQECKSRPDMNVWWINLDISFDYFH